MRIKFIYIAILFLLSSVVFAKQVKLDWNGTVPTVFGSDTVQMLSFVEADFGVFGALPAYHFQEELQGDVNSEYSFEVKISNPVYESIELKSNNFEGFDAISDEVETLAYKTIANKIGFVDVYVLPVIKKGVTLQFLKEFELSVIKTPKLKLKSASATTSVVYSAESVLATGKLVKVSVKEKGLHRLTYNDIVGMGLDPKTVRVYGNGGYQENPFFNNRKHDDLVENAVFFVNGSDGNFGSGDYLLFYHNGLINYAYNSSSDIYEPNSHEYSDKAYYYITSGKGSTKQVSLQAAVDEVETSTVTSFDESQMVQPRLQNLIHSGAKWYSQPIYVGNVTDQEFYFANIATDEMVKVQSEVVSRTTGVNAIFELKNGNTSLSTLSLRNTTAGVTGMFAIPGNIKGAFLPTSDNVAFALKYTSSEASGTGWYDYILATARRKLMYDNTPLYITDSKSFKANGVAKFVVDNADEDLIVLDVTDWVEPVQVPVTVEGTKAIFKSDVSELRTFAAFKTSDNFYKPKVEGNVANQNLHGLPQTDMIIISEANLMSEAEKLADLHRAEGLSIELVTPQEIYNEFSSGQADVAAIRWFLKMFYDRSTGVEDNIRYLLLFGHGSFDNRPGETEGRLLTYQSEESLDQSETYVSDDYFGLLDDSEGSAGTQDRVDIGVGRLPVSTPTQAAQVVAKIEHYMNNTNHSPWKNKVVFIGDDGDGNIHMNDANLMADKVAGESPELVVDKIFLDAYKQVTLSTGPSYPDVNRLVQKSVEDGVLMVNYSGHGSEVGLASEKILSMTDIKNYANLNNLPVWVTATCEFSRYDLIDEKSGGEELVLNPSGGGVGLFTTTRLVYSSANFIINYQFFNHAFENNELGEKNRLGDIFRKTKKAVGTGANKRKFALLGDPALQMVYPSNEVVITHINDVALGGKLDTLKALSDVTVKGYIKGANGNLDAGFNGLIYPTVYDKKVNKQTLGNTGGSSLRFNLWENILFSGTDSVKNGEFLFTFKVPKDINYEEGFGRIVLYASDDTNEANGYYEGFKVGGFNEEHDVDEAGPNLDIYINSEDFKDGSRVNTSPLLIAEVSDISGINTTGNSIGHDIIVMLNDDPNTMLILNDYYESEVGGYTSGKIKYRIFDLPEGNHTLMLRVWDVYNNSTTKTINFVVESDVKPEIKDIIAYPNPAKDEVNFRLTHDRPDDVLKVYIDIYDFAGNKMVQLEEQTYSSGDETPPIKWDLKSPSGTRVSPGMYLYRIRIENGDNISVSTAQKLLVR